MKANPTLTKAIRAALGTGVVMVSVATAQARSYHFDIQNESLSQALRNYGQISGQEIIFTEDVLSDSKPASLKGDYTAEAAIERLLKGTGLTAEHSPSGALMIRRQIQAAAALTSYNENVADESSAQFAQADTSSTSPSTGMGESAQRADQPQSPSPSPREGRGEEKLQEIVVTANRRRQTLEEVPYSITAVSADQIARTGVTDLASLARQVPGLSMYDWGVRNTAEMFPIIRGVNASGPTAIQGGFHTIEQAPVGTYIGNSPINGYFQFDDIQRVEVLRGPQGTLYGAGALGGALRVIPNAPELGRFTGRLEAGGGTLAHSGGASYTTSAMFNVPIGDTLAFRASGKYAYEPGFINVYGFLERPGSLLSGIPALANPADPVNSSGVFSGKSDWNHWNTFTGRASLLWKPVEQFSADLAFMYANVNGDGGPVVNPDFPGGAYPLDPRITFPPGGPYQFFRALDQPWSRRTKLSSLDLSYDAGFATLSSTSSYFTTTGSTAGDLTYGYAGTGFIGYYSGTPINPRFINTTLFVDTTHTFTQEVRLVSTTGPDKLFDYVVGVFYENQTSEGSQTDANPGSPEYSVAEGCTAPYFFGASFPNCLLGVGPGDINFLGTDAQRFKDTSEFGELTWHFVRHGQITFGGRHFEQTFTDAQSTSGWPFALFAQSASSSPASKNTWKISPSYEYAKDQHVYALWSQGFRRGGANGVTLAGAFKESPALLSYAPDAVNNYEIGLKGRFDTGLSYSFDVFDIEWDKPQVGGVTPDGEFYVVWNANKARSRGAEFDLNTPLLLPGLSLKAGGSYVDAKFTQDYFITAGISGTAGQQLPGTPKVNAAATINYDRNILPGYDMTVSLNDTYRSTVQLQSFVGAVPVSGMNIVNLSASVAHKSWRLGAYVTNVADRQVVLVPGYNPRKQSVEFLPDQTVVNPPREIALRLSYSFGQ